MRQDIKNFVNGLNRRNFTNNTQRVLYALLQGLEKADDGWVNLASTRIGSAPSRARDLRKERFGPFTVECSTTKSIGRNNKANYMYRLASKGLTITKLRRVFGEV